ncbi:binuclear zinc transcription factor [Zalerion maritima]|uniref:Binuclear zinc transcription factor n=1 Tax=Zalerion maritima TaxID=339359 RepID=A0AAD5RXK5_9PEZI|nr:binuclear zinc transcription factor [Zalerion maritima]
MTSTDASPVDDAHSTRPSSETSPNTTTLSSTLNQNSNAEAAAAIGGDNSNIPKPKRMACMICRKRKLRCDGAKPSCSTCTRLNHTCAYDEVRRKSGPKRGYVKALEERLKQVETLLKTQEPPPSGNVTTSSASTSQPKRPSGLGQGSPSTGQSNPHGIALDFNMAHPPISIPSDRDMDRWNINPAGNSPQNPNMDDFNFNAGMIPPDLNQTNNFTYEIMQLGLQEPLPPQDTIDEMAPTQRPPVCLRYAMWTLACSVTDKYQHHKDIFYDRARKYLEADYIKGHGEHMISAGHAQTHILLAKYELKMMFFPRAWMSTGSGVRLCQMMGLHRLDGTGLDVKQCIPPPRDWTEKEERRRTFWMAFCEDRYASIGTGWPMAIDENDISTNLPTSDDAFDLSRPETALSLSESMSPSGAAKLSSFGGIVLMACLFGKNLVHLHRPDADDRNHDLNGEFWKRHRHMDNILLNTSLCLPSQMKLPAGLSNPNVVFTNMCIHTSTICLHQAAIFTADKHSLPASVSAESKIRCITAANEIASIMRMVSHMDLSAMNPFISFCLYVAARVFVQYLKSLPDDSKTIDSLRFLLSAMNAIKRRNPLTESFLVQLDVDLEALGVRIPKLKALFPRSGDNAPGMLGNPHSKKDQAVQGSRIGIMSSYNNECLFMKMSGDDGNPAGAPEIITPSNNSQGQQDTQMSGTPGQATGGGGGGGQTTGYHSGQGAWSPGDHRGLPQREKSGGESLQQHLSGIMMNPGSGRMFDKSNTSSAGISDSNNDVSVSPEHDMSKKPTPNSSAASEHMFGNNTGSGNNNLAPGPMNTRSGSTSFSPSPASGSQNLGMGSGDGAASLFAATSVYGLGPSGITPDQRFTMPNTSSADFGTSEGWDIQGQQGVAEGVLRNLMNMGTLEMMDQPPPMGWGSGDS